ncbi:hypothetical protein GC177_06960 [bacterium]|nr:hypothetical protein [bacterium]
MSNARSKSFAPEMVHVTPKRVGLIDIGSNSVRLVLYDRVGKVPLATFNEKVQCALGQGLAMTGRLNPIGKERAALAIKRFVALARAMGVSEITALATAACRMASDGEAFIKKLKKDLQIDIHIITGDQEAELGAWGVLGSIDAVDGMACDLGGASMELAAVDIDGVHQMTSLPVGVLSIFDESGADRKAARKQVDDALAGAASVTASMKGKTLYAIGGSFRALAKIYMEETAYPLRFLHEYVVESEALAGFCERIAKMQSTALLALPGVRRKRADTLMAASIVMQRLIAAGKPKCVMFSMQGIREGWLYRQQPVADPLLEVAKEVTLYHGGDVAFGEMLDEWMTPIFPRESVEWRRLRHTACLLATIPRYELSAERSEAAFYDVLQSPLLAMGHGSRFLLALAVMRRYQHSAPIPLQGWQRLNIEPIELERARLVGLAINLAYTLSGGVGEVLKLVHIRKGDGAIALESDLPDLVAGEVVEKRTARINQSLAGIRSSEALDC